MTVFCRATATGSNNGTSWENAYTSLQAAYDAAGAAEQVWVTEGVIAHTAALDFDNTNNPNIYGGFSASLTGTDGSAATRAAGARTTLDGAGSYSGIVLNGWGGTLDGFKFLNMYLNGSGSAIQGTDSSGDVYLRNSEFDGCDSLGNGGAIALVRCGNFRIYDTTFVDCTAVSVGGAIRTFDTLIQTFRCLFDGNHSNNDGGAINIDNAGGLARNTVFTGNSARYGGAVCVETGASWLSTSSTFADNTCTTASGGGAVYNKSTHNAVNSIFWGNEANGAAHQLNSATSVTYCVVEGGWSGTGNKTGNPQFVGSGDHPYALTSPTSSAIDAGNSSGLWYPTTDILGNSRYDDPAVTDTGAGTITYADIGAYEYTPPPPPASVPGLKKFLYGDDYGYLREQDPADGLELGGLALTGDISMDSNQIIGLSAASAAGEALAYGLPGASLSGLTVTDGPLHMSSQQVTNVADGTVSHNAVNLSQLEDAITLGRAWKELLLCARQTNNAQGILPAGVIYMAAQPVSGDTVTLTNGASTRTFGAGSGGDVQYTIGATVAATMQNLSDAIEADGTAWVSDFDTSLESINADGVIYIIPFLSSGGESEIYGTWATQSNIQLVDYTGELDYTKKSSSNLPSSAPGATNFGFRRPAADLVPGEAHYVENADHIEAWDDDASVWNTVSGDASVSDATAASGGGVKGKITVDSDAGLSVVTGILSIDLATNKGLGFDGSNDLQGLADTTAGMEITSSGFAIDLAADKGLGFDGSGDLQGLADATAGMETTSSGFAIDIGATNPGLGFDGSGDLEIKAVSTGGVEKAAGGLQIKIDDTPDTLDVDADGLKVVGVPTLFKIAGTAVGATVTAVNLDDLTDGSNADSLHSHAGVNEAKAVENTFTATEDVTIGDPVYFDTAGNAVSKALANNDSKYEAIGVAKATILATNDVDVVSIGPADVLAGATAGDRYYLAAAGGLTTTIPGAGNWVVVMGFAHDANTLMVMPRTLHKRVA